MDNGVPPKSEIDLAAARACFLSLTDLAHIGISNREKTRVDTITTAAGSHSVAIRCSEAQRVEQTLCHRRCPPLSSLPPALLIDDSMRLARAIGGSGEVVDLRVWPLVIYFPLLRFENPCVAKFLDIFELVHR